MGANSDYYTNLRQEARAFAEALLLADAGRMADTKRAHEELLHRPEKTLHERQIAFYAEVISVLETTAAGLRSDSATAVAGILGEQFADHVAVGTPEEVQA